MIPTLQPNDPIPVAQTMTTNVGPELLTPGATVYVPARGCRPPLIISYGGAWVNQCANTPYVLPFFYANCQYISCTPWRSSSWCVTPSFSTHILRLDTLEWIHLGQNATGPDSLSPVATNATGLFGLGVTVVYDANRDRLLMTGAHSEALLCSTCNATLVFVCTLLGGYNRIRVWGHEDLTVCNTLQTMDLSALCTDADSMPPAASQQRQSNADTAPSGYSLRDLDRWRSGRLWTERLQWVQAASCMQVTIVVGHARH